jgi:hypothetical protein
MIAVLRFLGKFSRGLLRGVAVAGLLIAWHGFLVAAVMLDAASLSILGGTLLIARFLLPGVVRAAGRLIVAVSSRLAELWFWLGGVAAGVALVRAGYLGGMEAINSTLYAILFGVIVLVILVLYGELVFVLAGLETEPQVPVRVPRGLPGVPTFGPLLRDRWRKRRW